MAVVTQGVDAIPPPGGRKYSSLLYQINTVNQKKTASSQSTSLLRKSNTALMLLFPDLLKTLLLTVNCILYKDPVLFTSFVIFPTVHQDMLHCLFLSTEIDLSLVLSRRKFFIHLYILHFIPNLRSLIIKLLFFPESTLVLIMFSNKYVYLSFVFSIVLC